MYYKWTDFRQRDHEVVVGPSAFVEAWGSKAKKPYIFNKIMFWGPCRLRPGEFGTVFWSVGLPAGTSRRFTVLIGSRYGFNEV